VEQTVEEGREREELAARKKVTGVAEVVGREREELAEREKVAGVAEREKVAGVAEVVELDRYLRR